MLPGVNAEGMLAADVDADLSKEIIVDFGALGVWMWASGVWIWNSGGWGQLTSVNPEGLIGEGIQ